MKKVLLIVAAILVFILLAFVVKTLFIQVSPVKSYTVTLTEDGFKPGEISIKKGDTVTFKTNAGKPFWPASDIHPTHGIYPEFDPKQAITKDKTWSFKFDKVGRWSYHDHLAPYLTGKVIVK